MSGGDVSTQPRKRRRSPSAQRGIAMPSVDPQLIAVHDKEGERRETDEKKKETKKKQTKDEKNTDKNTTKAKEKKKSRFAVPVRQQVIL